MKKSLLSLTALVLFLAFSVTARAGGDNHLLLLRYPTMSKTTIVFEYGGQLWAVPRAGGQAHVLASGMDLLTKPIFSPNGKWIVFTGTYDHNTDVYIVPAKGGQPERLTYHPGPDIAVGWTRDGKSILFRSHRYSYSDPNQLYTVPISSGFPHELPLSMAEDGSYSPDGEHLAYVPIFQWEPFWKGYKGGQHTQIWIARLSDSHTIRIPNMNANESEPMWVGDTIYFLSDRDGPITLFAYDVDSKKASKLITNKGFDITSASAGPGGIVYSQFGQLHIYDYSSGKTTAVPVTVKGDLPQRRARYEDVADEVNYAGMSPNGVRGVFGAHGDIFTVPTKHGSIVNLTHSSGSMERDPAWSPNGKYIAYFSDRDGEYDLYISPQDGIGPVQKVKLGQDNAYYYNLRWSPDNKKLVFSDQKFQLWVVNIETANPQPVKIATNSFTRSFDASWSPDSRWIAYTKQLPNFMNAVFIYSLVTGESHQMSHGRSFAMSPRFDPNGKYLYFTASTNIGPSLDFDLASFERPVTSYVYAVTLAADTASPVAPKTGFEKTKHKEHDKTKKKHGKSKKEKAPAVHVDFDGLLDRTVPLPVKPARYADLEVGKSGVLFLQKVPTVRMPDNGAKPAILRFKLETKKTKRLQYAARLVALSTDGQKMLYRKGHKWFISATKPKAKPKAVKLEGMRVRVKPRKQWAQMYHEAWRIERAFFYNPIYDGLDIGAAEKLFAHYLPGIASRNGLSFLFREMLSYMAVGHMFIYGGYVPTMQEVKVGLLGANYKVEHGRYRIARIFTGGKWNPKLYAPLAQPGLKVKVGDYVLAVNGRPIDADESIYAAFEDMANQTVTLTVGPNPGLEDSHEITVKTIPSERKLRKTAWVAHNMELVNKLSGGKLAYIYLPDTNWGGLTNFNRYFFSQADKQGAIIDERFNHGGSLSDYIIQYLTRKPMALAVNRWGERTTAVLPQMQIAGPKVMIINQFSGSGGDALPWYFKKEDVGPLVGVRTWGGLVGIGGYPELMDGGTVTAPRIAVEGLDGTFPVENHGIAPDVKVWQDPEKMRQGLDPQLKRAVEIALKQLEAHPPKEYKRAPWRNYHPELPPLPEPAGSAR